MLEETNGHKGILMDITRRRSVSTVLGRDSATVHNNPKTPRKGCIGQRHIMIRHVRRQLAESYKIY